MGHSFCRLICTAYNKPSSLLMSSNRSGLLLFISYGYVVTTSGRHVHSAADVYYPMTAANYPHLVAGVLGLLPTLQAAAASSHGSHHSPAQVSGYPGYLPGTLVAL